MSSLWTPEGEVNLLEKNVSHLTAQEGAALKAMHAVAQKYNIGLVCMRCDKAIQGANSGAESAYAVACQCRELRFPAGGK